MSAFQFSNGQLAMLQKAAGSEAQLARRNMREASLFTSDPELGLDDEDGYAFYIENAEVHQRIAAEWSKDARNAYTVMYLKEKENV